jgi:hypothetical protein
MLQKMRQRSTYNDFVLLLALRRSGKFLRSFGKQWEAVLPTFLLRINEVGPNCAEEKNAQFPLPPGPAKGSGPAETANKVTVIVYCKVVVNY